MEKTYIGIDGCRGGWVFAYRLDEKWKIEFYRNLEDADMLIEKSEVICIDMPMGLPETARQERECDTLLRKLLGYPFSSTVFNVPCRQSVYADNYEDANELNKEILGKGLSKQSWNISSKIKELDIYIKDHNEMILNFRECHPELAFKCLKGSLLQHKKKMNEGIQERIHILKRYSKLKETGIFKLVETSSAIKKDDILDAMVLSLTAQGMTTNRYATLPENIPYDSCKIPMAVYYLTNNSFFSG